MRVLAPTGAEKSFDLIQVIFSLCRKSVSMQPVSSSFSVLSRPSSSIPYRCLAFHFSILDCPVYICPHLHRQSLITHRRSPTGAWLFICPLFLNTKAVFVFLILSSQHLPLIPSYLNNPIAATTPARGWSRCPDTTTTEALP